MKYANAAALRQALEERLRTQAMATGMPLVRLRKMVAFERLLARLVSDQKEAWILKGGFALELRLGSRARTTNDLDLLAVVAYPPQRMHQVLLQAAHKDFKDGFYFEIQEATAAHPERYTVQALVDGRTFETFHLDIGTNDPIVGPIEYITTPNLLAFAEIPEVIVPCYPLTQQLAEKVHAYTLVYASGETTRVKDWVDILLIAQTGTLSAKRLQSSLEATFEARNTHPLPKTMPPPPLDWARTFDYLSAQVQLGFENLDEANRAMRAFLEPILSGQAQGNWNPSTWYWQ